MPRNPISHFFFSICVLIILVLSVYTFSKGQVSDLSANEPVESIAMLAFSVGLIGIGFFIRRQLRR